MRMAACRVTYRVEDYDEDELGDDVGGGAIAELPSAVPTWPPRTFTPREFYTKS